MPTTTKGIVRIIVEEQSGPIVRMTDQARKAVLDLVDRHYCKSDEPLFLSSVGQALRGQKLWPIEGEKKSLKDWLGSLTVAHRRISLCVRLNIQDMALSIYPA